MLKLQGSPTALGAEKSIVVRKLVWACSLQGRAGTSAWTPTFSRQAGAAYIHLLEV